MSGPEQRHRAWREPHPALAISEQLYAAYLDWADKDAAWAMLDDCKTDVLAELIEKAIEGKRGDGTKAGAERWVRARDPEWKSYRENTNKARLAKSCAWAYVSRLRSLEREQMSVEADNRTEMRMARS